MIGFKKEWAAGMDGAHTIPAHIAHWAITLDSGYASDAVDISLALACEYASELDEAVNNLNYIIGQLTIARDHMKNELRQEQEK